MGMVIKHMEGGILKGSVNRAASCSGRGGEDFVELSMCSS